MIFSTKVKDGWIMISEENSKLIRAFCAPYEGKTVYISLSGRTHPRSLQQNSYLWGVVYDYMSNETGMTPEEIHDDMKQRFLPRMWTVEEGREVELPKSTQRLTTAEFKRFIDEVVAFAARELNISIPPPQKWDA